MQKTWFVTGASRGLGAEVVRAALRAGDQVVAAVRDRAAGTAAFGSESHHLALVQLDVTDAAQARVAVDAARSRFNSIDVLVNNAGYGSFGFFEESTLRDATDQIATNLLGVLNVTWAALPAMRAARKGRIFNLSSIAGFVGGQMASLYCATKFAVEGFSESLAKEVAPFGIQVTLIEPGPFRTDFLGPQSVRFAQKRIGDYDDRRSAMLAGFEERDGRQPGDPAKLAAAMVNLAATDKAPLHFPAGSVAVSAAEQKLAGRRAELHRWRHLSISTDGAFGNDAMSPLGDAPPDCANSSGADKIPSTDAPGVASSR